MSNNHYFQVAVIGGGISGSALLYTLARYTDIKSVALFEKYGEIGSVNTNAKSNSQTLHCGDIETNYTFEKAKKVKRTANMLERYALQHGYGGKHIHKVTKMALGVGDEEVAYIKARYEEFVSFFPYMELWDEEALAEIEPTLLEGREEPIIAMGAQNEYSAIDFGAIAKSFVDNAEKEPKKDVSVFLDTEIKAMKKRGDKTVLQCDRGEFFADFVVVDAGAHSLLLAHEMGFGEEYSCLPIGGSFFYAKKNVLNSKVYTVQNPKLPFAAVHGDPDLVKDGVARFGPTALALPKLERYKASHFLDFLHSLSPDEAVLKVFYDLLKDDDIRDYVFRNFIYEIPGIRRKEFVKELRKIIPSIKADEIKFAKNIGGLRPQVIDKVKKQLLLGEAKIETDVGVIFNMTPSPGATSCLGNAEVDVKLICEYLDQEFYKKKFKDELT
ncbi:MAG: FAD-dependent oxidoreductase [Campylobacterota bacterium]